MLTYSNEDFKTLLKEIFWVSGKKFGILSENKDHNGSVSIAFHPFSTYFTAEHFSEL